MTPPSNSGSANVSSARNQTLGQFLKDARLAAHLTLRDVEAKTDKAVTNGYLSQIESDTINQPSPNVLFSLAGVYGLDYRDLLERAGHHVPSTTRKSTDVEDAELAGLPLRALADLNEQERQELTEYIAFLRQRRKRRSE